MPVAASLSAPVADDVHKRRQHTRAVVMASLAEMVPQDISAITGQTRLPVQRARLMAIVHKHVAHGFLPYTGGAFTVDQLVDAFSVPDAKFEWL